MVYEVDQENRVVRLESIEKPVDQQPETALENKAAATDESMKEAKWSTEIEALLAPIMSSRVLKELQDLVTLGPNGNLVSSPSVDIIPEGPRTGETGAKGTKKRGRGAGESHFLVCPLRNSC